MLSRVSRVLRATHRSTRLSPSPLRRPSPSSFAVAAAARRPFSDVTFTFVDGEGESTSVTAKEGTTLLDVAHENDVELEGACGGELACSTCHLVLGCQIQVTKEMEGMTVRIPEETDNLM
ncbi:hypothetical protein BBJ29_004635 [Phytophthora kernoviae]|uniref:2Fe-2S ferredoxin-type domain-containing protein n=1 Tax=Phytophthora kernoviae TaxID=325452 RepID=A0A3F2RJX3_9STRA|nr:hypothetical protein BBJ29_004635 [Phytophthora kernoviae]RLN58730.1 hypothetical protein BBP00_00006855 [Phytophthora kernoviae]